MYILYYKFDSCLLFNSYYANFSMYLDLRINNYIFAKKYFNNTYIEIISELKMRKSIQKSVL
jgi:hypothetical protein